MDINGKNNDQEMHHKDFWSKIFIMERDLVDINKAVNKLSSENDFILKKLENLREDLRNKKDVGEFISTLEEVRGLVDDLRQEMPEIRLIRKIVFAIIAFILTAFLGLLWNITLQPPTHRGNIEELTAKIIQQYKMTENAEK